MWTFLGPSRPSVSSWATLSIGPDPSPMASGLTLRPQVSPQGNSNWQLPSHTHCFPLFNLLPFLPCFSHCPEVLSPHFLCPGETRQCLVRSLFSWVCTLLLCVSLPPALPQCLPICQGICFLTISSEVHTRIIPIFQISTQESFTRLLRVTQDVVELDLNPDLSFLNACAHDHSRLVL